MKSRSIISVLPLVTALLMAVASLLNILLQANYLAGLLFGEASALFLFASFRVGDKRAGKNAKKKNKKEPPTPA